MKAKGITLTELVIATVLVSVVVLATMAISVSARRFLTASRLLSRVQNEASFALAHIHKNVRLGIGSILNPGIEDLNLVLPDAGFKVRIDRDDNGRPNDSIDDGIEYRYQSLDEEIRFTPDLSVPETYEVIAEGITTFNYTIAGNSLTIDNLTATRESADGSIIHSTTLETEILLRQMSWN